MSSELDYLFNPRSIAVVGLSSDPDKVTGMKWVTSMQEMGFKGALYPVSSSFNEINGLKVYSSLTDIPDEVDLVIGCVPARYAPQLVEDCVTKKVKFLQFFTAGFSETGDVDGVVLEQKITEIAGRGNLRIVGPNCMGVYSPRHCISWRSDFPTESGPVAVISQSGMNAVKMVNTGKVRGVRFSNLISYGNAVDLNEVDFLNYFAADSESKVIVVYIEGVKNAPQFLDALRNAAITKPVIVLKGGCGDAGTRTVRSHTASLAGSADVWNSALKQAGAIRVHNYDEMFDTALAFLHLPIPLNRSVAIVGSGGGPSVLAADECEKMGLAVPPLPADIQAEIGKLVPKAGTMWQNPVDLPLLGNLETFRQVTELIAAHQEIASLILHFEIDSYRFFGGQKFVREISETVITSDAHHSKPVTVVLATAGFREAMELISEAQQRFHDAGVPVYPTIARAAQAISKLLVYPQSTGNP